MKEKRWNLLSGAALKWAAIIIMLTDHIGASLIEQFIAGSYGFPFPAQSALDGQFWYRIDLILRCIGRSAFPIFCFLLVEGAVHTHNARRYALRLAAFAAISEIPFDLALTRGAFSPQMQNVFFTLLLGFLCVQAFRRCAEQSWKAWLFVFAACALAELLHTDYGAVGILVIVMMYLLRDRFWQMIIFSYLFLSLVMGMEIYSLPGFLLLGLYNGKKGRQPRWFFYAFYPAHLLVLWAAGTYLLPLFR